MKFLRDIWRTYVTDLRDATDAESAEYRAKTSPSEVTKRFVFVIFGATACMLVVRFLGNVEDTAGITKPLNALGLERAAKWFVYLVTKSPEARLYQRVWWASARITGYLILPLLLMRFAAKVPLKEAGLKLGGASQFKTYALLFAIVAPFIFAASYGTAFQNKYPYYRVQRGESLWPGFILWELLYATQFMGIEFFFRGYFIHGLRKAFGYGAVFVPIVPYLTIHFGKPLPEAIGSIITGFVLGTLSLKTKSIWGGVAVHALVACSMDVLSLWHRGLL